VARARKTFGARVSDKMQQASIDLDFELAAHYRDQLIGLRTIQEQHTSTKYG
jgi:Excinuclease ABC subunit C